MIFFFQHVIYHDICTYMFLYIYRYLCIISDIEKMLSIFRNHTRTGDKRLRQKSKETNLTRINGRIQVTDQHCILLLEKSIRRLVCGSPPVSSILYFPLRVIAAFAANILHDLLQILQVESSLVPLPFYHSLQYSLYQTLMS